MTIQEAAAIRAEILNSPATSPDKSTLSPESSLFYTGDIGFFYLIQLEPNHDAGRFKVGFTTDLSGRLQKHRCSAPFAQYVKHWQSKRVWERAAIDCVTDACEQLHTEVFRATAINLVCARADAWFELMPKLTSKSGEDDEPA